MKRFLKCGAVVCATVALISLLLALTSCGNSATTTVRYLNFKPEVADKYRALADLYKKETGVQIIVDTAANNTYEQTLAARMSTSEQPTLFQINGPKGYAAWKDHCADLKDTALYNALTDKSLAITGEDGQVVGIPYVVEGYGILYNKALTDRYFALQDRNTSFTSMDEIRSFDSLKRLVEDMQAHKSELHIDGVFASTSMKTGEDWRWQTHLANLPIYYEFQARGIDLSGDETHEIDFRYAENFKNIFDLYLDNSTIARGAVGTKTVTDSMAEFALEKCVMVQNGNWAWEQIRGVSGNKVKEEDLAYLPIYTGVEGEESQGLCIGTENFYAINKNCSPEQQKAAADFIYWMYSSEVGKRYITEQLGFIAPFNTFTEEERPTDPLAQEILAWMDKEDVRVVPWHFTLFPSAAFKEGLGSSLLRYAQGSKSWDAVVADTIRTWKSESDAVG